MQPNHPTIRVFIPPSSDGGFFTLFFRPSTSQKDKGNWSSILFCVSTKLKHNFSLSPVYELIMSFQPSHELLQLLASGETPFFQDLVMQLDKIRSLSNRLLAGSVPAGVPMGAPTAVPMIPLSQQPTTPVFSYTPLTGPISITNEICDFTIQNVPDSSLADEGNLLYTRRYGVSLLLPVKMKSTLESYRIQISPFSIATSTIVSKTIKCM